MTLEIDGREDAPWKLRYRTRHLLGCQVAVSAPGRGLVVTSDRAVLQLHAWEVETGALRALTRDPLGVPSGVLDPLGRHVYYLEDVGGGEVGHVARVPWSGGAPTDLTPGLEPYQLIDLAISRDGRRLAFVTATRAGFSLWVASLDEDGTASGLRPLVAFAERVQGLCLSADGAVAVVARCPRPDALETGLLSIDLETGETLATLEQRDVSYAATAFAPDHGDPRVLGVASQRDATGPVVWDARQGALLERPTFDLPGEVRAVGWLPGARSALLVHLHAARMQLGMWALDTSSFRETPVTGVLSSPSVLADGLVVAQRTDSSSPPCIVRIDPVGGELRVLLPSDPGAPVVGPWRSVSFPSADGTSIQGWLAVPRGAGPFPTVIHLHGGPATAVLEDWHPPSHAWVDHGFAFLSINYRGSTTFGHAFETAIYGDVGRLEVEDVVAGVEWLVEEGVARRDAVFVTGASYGGYLTLLLLGTHPARFAAGMALIAIGDWTLLYEDELEWLRRYQVGMFGGTPEELPELYARASPITYAERVEAPVLVIQATNDPRTAPRQLRAYEERMRALGKQIEVDWFEAGHGSFDLELLIAQQARVMSFALRVLAAR